MKVLVLHTYDSPKSFEERKAIHDYFEKSKRDRFSVEM
ncbi:MAG: hypothetical protein QG670_383 [Thermoproteota archaeon]|nr:hypothetical protein [Thermoproteota archaeon]